LRPSDEPPVPVVTTSEVPFLEKFHKL
jgi:hypothetical protein